MIASVAYMAGLDVKSDAVQTLTYACLAGVSVAEVVKKTGMAFGTKMTMALLKKTRKDTDNNQPEGRVPIPYKVW